jgi:signal peptidase I
MRSRAGAIISAVIVLASIIVSAAVIWGSTSRSYWTVSGNSMRDTYYDGDVLYGTRTQDVQPGDVVIVERPPAWTLGSITNDRELVKRVLAVPGDVVCVEPGGMISSIHGCQDRVAALDGRESSYAAGCGLNPDDRVEIRIPSGKIFLRGDNVNASYDGRYAYCSGEDPLVDSSSIDLKIKGSVPIGRWTAELRSTVFGEDS